jgi:hypothetical protein
VRKWVTGTSRIESQKLQENALWSDCRRAFLRPGRRARGRSLARAPGAEIQGEEVTQPTRPVIVSYELDGWGVEMGYRN